MKKGIAIALLTASALVGFAQTKETKVPAYRGVIEHVQPNGDTLHIYLRGDENAHYRMTTDGWQVAENSKGVLCYMKKRCNGTTQLSCKQAHDPSKRRCIEKRWLKRKGVMKIENQE